MVREGRAYSGMVNGAFIESHEPPLSLLPDVTIMPVRESVLIHISQLPFFTWYMTVSHAFPFLT